MNILLEAFAKSFELVFTLNEDLFEILLLSLKVSGISLLLSCLIGLPLGTFFFLVIITVFLRSVFYKK